jgi:hypothetical protein
LLSGWLSSADNERVRTSLRRYAPTWCLQFPGTFGSAGTLQQLQHETIGANKERMVRELADAFATLASTEPVILFLEDLHWADPGTADLLRHIAQRSAAQRSIVIGTVRAEHLPGSHPAVRNCIRDLQAPNLGEHIPVRAFDEHHLAAYLNIRFAPNRFPPAVPDAIHARTEGHPMFSAGLFDLLVERGHIARVEGTWQVVTEIAKLGLEVPETIRDMIARKLERLEPEQYRALQYASIEGEEFSSAVLATLLDVEDLAVEESLEALARGHGLIQTVAEEELPDRSVTTRYRFTHALYHNVLYDSVLAKRRAHLHRIAAEKLVQLYATETSRIAIQLATHFERCREYGRAIEYFIQAAGKAISQFASATAVEHYSHALLLAEKLAPQEQHHVRAALLHQRGIAHLALGRLSDAEHDLLAMLEVARALGASGLEGTALNALAGVYLYAHKLEEMKASAVQALAIAEMLGDDVLRAEAAANLAEYHQASGNLVQAKSGFETILRSVRERAPLMAVTYRAVLHFFQTEYEDADRALLNAKTLATGKRDGFYLALSMFFRGLTLGNLGRVSEALATLTDAMDLARRNGNQIMLSRSNGIGWLYREMQDPDRSLEYDLAGLELARRNKTTESEANSLINIAYDYTLTGQFDKAFDALQEVAAIHDRGPWMRWRYYGIRYEAAASELWLARGEPERAAAHAQRLIANAERHHVPKYVVEACRLLAECAIANGGLANAEEYLLRAIEVLNGHPAPLIAWKVYRTLGRLHTLRSDSPSAAGAYGQSLKIIQALCGTVDDAVLASRFKDSAPVRDVFRCVSDLSSAQS